MPPAFSRALRPFPFAVVLSAALACAACASGDAQFETRYASDYDTAPHRAISVLGVFKDGNMNAEAWEDLGPMLSPSLHAKKCEAAYARDRMAADPDLTSAIDDYARDNGITDDFLAEFAPAAKGDGILIVTVAGRPPRMLGADAGGGGSATRAPSMRNVGSHRSRSASPSSMGGGGDPLPLTDQNVFEMSASLFSVKLHRAVAVVSMSYSGRSMEEAMKQFGQKLGAAFPQSTCVGWNPDVKVDGKKIRSLAEGS